MRAATANPSWVYLSVGFMWFIVPHRPLRVLLTARPRSPPGLRALGSAARIRTAQPPQGSVTGSIPARSGCGIGADRPGHSRDALGWPGERPVMMSPERNRTSWGGGNRLPAAGILLGRAGEVRPGVKDGAHLPPRLFSLGREVLGGPESLVRAIALEHPAGHGGLVHLVNAVGDAHGG